MEIKEKKYRLIEVAEGFGENFVASSNDLERITLFAQATKRFYESEGKTIKLIIKSTETIEI